MEFVLLPFPQLLFSAAIFLAAAVLLISNRLSRRYHPVVGTFLHQLIHSRRLYHYHTELSRRHKSFRIFMGPFNSIIYTSDPAVVEHVLRSSFHNYGKGERTHENMEDLLGDGIFAVDGSKWRHQRKVASYEFTTRSLREHSGAVFKKNAVKVAQVVSDAAGSQQAIEIQDLFIKASTDSIFEVVCGIELNCLQGSSEERSGFVKALDDANSQINRRFINPFWKIMRFLNTGMEKTLRQNIRVVDDYLYKVIHSKIAKMSNKTPGESNVDKDDILSRFMQEDPNKSVDHKYLRDITLNFVVAGKDSTAGALSWFLYLLCKHPSVQEKIAREVKQAVKTGEHATFQEFAENLTDAALENMQYLYAAINETLRLYPVIPLDPKVCFSDDTLPDGFSIRKGETITYQPYCMGRMKYIWGEDAEEFRPERWLDENGIVRPENPFKFSVFQAGPRICLGKEFAYRQMKILSAVLLRFFVFQLRNEKETVGYKMTMTLLVDPGIYVHVVRK
ncbi:hypothetical protein Taro_014631 [Colocasia esculenta]|uniref:Uncharacterized protein n=1 Tax=Colocasia esculenta TaxID=4460 RepID=A0A843UFH6_COLES|nr:hypothetical protein [Colocasia esculenta]